MPGELSPRPWGIRMTGQGGGKRGYRVIDHTADLGIRVFGRGLEELFANAAFALFDQLTDLDKVREESSSALRVEGAGMAELLVRWLNELLYRSESEGWLFKSFSISHLEPNSLDAVARGEKFDPSRHEWKREIKAATYHQLEIQERDGRWEGRVIFDL